MIYTLQFIVCLGTISLVKSQFNVLSGTYASQSSTEKSETQLGIKNIVPDAPKAIDGNSETSFGLGSCTQTQNEPAPWWMANMVVQRNIRTVIVINREDCCSERLTNYDIRVGNSKIPWDNPKCNIVPLSGGGVFPCDLKGQFLSITMGPGVLTLCEVKAFEGPNVALGKMAYQSSTFIDWDRGNPQNPIRSISISGDYYKLTCSSTNTEPNPYWFVDLGEITPVAGISLLPRMDCCSERTINYQVFVGNNIDISKNAQCSGTYSRDADVFCGISGRFVGIKASNQLLQICGFAVISGVISPPTGYWQLVASGSNIKTSLERGISNTAGTEHTVQDQYSFSVSLQQEVNFRDIYKTQINLGFQYSRTIADAVRSDITTHSTVGCEATCEGENGKIKYMYQWTMDADEAYGSQKGHMSLKTCHFVCVYERTGPKCPLLTCVDDECQNCFH